MFILNVLISALVISLSAWLAERRPDLAGFIVSLPLSTLLVLALNQMQYRDETKATLLAKSIFVAIPSTLVFFIPFLLTERLKLSFWAAFGMGALLLVPAFFIHRALYAYLSQ